MWGVEGVGLGVVEWGLYGMCGRYGMCGKYGDVWKVCRRYGVWVCVEGVELGVVECGNCTGCVEGMGMCGRYGVWGGLWIVEGEMCGGWDV